MFQRKSTLAPFFPKRLTFGMIGSVRSAERRCGAEPKDYRDIITGRSEFSSTCCVTPPTIDCRNLECE